MTQHETTESVRGEDALHPAGSRSRHGDDVGGEIADRRTASVYPQDGPGGMRVAEDGNLATQDGNIHVPEARMLPEVVASDRNGDQRDSKCGGNGGSSDKETSKEMEEAGSAREAATPARHQDDRDVSTLLEQPLPWSDHCRSDSTGTKHVAARLHRPFLMRMNQFGGGMRNGGGGSKEEGLGGGGIDREEISLWEIVRANLSTLSADDGERQHDGEGEEDASNLRAALGVPMGESRMTFLHVCCMNQPPTDVIDLVLEVSPMLAGRVNSRGMLPLHLAARYQASEGVVRILIRANPESIHVSDDRMGRTPLFYALDPQPPSESMAKFVRRYKRPADRQDRRFFPDPGVVRLLIRPDMLRDTDVDGAGLNTLFASLCRAAPPCDAANRKRGEKIMDLILECRPPNSVEFTKILLALPQWALKVALDHPYVKGVLNEKSAQPLCVFFVLLDLAVQMFVVASFVKATYFIAENGDQEDLDISTYVRYGGLLYESFRLWMQIYGFWKLEKTRLWLGNVWNWIAVLNVVLLFVATLMLDLYPEHFIHYKPLITLAGGVQWFGLIAILKVTNIPFSVFVTSAGSILYNLIPFMVTTLILLGGFAFMYYTINYNSPDCMEETDADDGNGLNIDFCSIQNSFLSAFTMFVGDVDSDVYTGDPFTRVLSIAFAFLMVVLQLNVLIAVITDSYTRVKDVGESVFWHHRFFFLAEVDSLRNWALRYRCVQWISSRYDDTSIGFSRRWDWAVWTLFDDSDEYRATSTSFWERAKQGFLRTALFFILLVWCILGLATLGWLWPPQVREMIFCQETHADDADDETTPKTPVAKNDNDGTRDREQFEKETRKRLDEIERRMEDIERLRQEQFSNIKQTIEEMHQMLSVLVSGRSGA